MMKFHKIFSIILIIIGNLIKIFPQSIEMPMSPDEFSDSVIFLEEVKVEAYQLNGLLRTIPGSMSVLTGEGINQSDGTSLATTLNSLPGLYMQSGTYTTNRIVIRGMGSRTPYNTNRIRTYFNDIPLTSSDGISAPEEIDLQSLGRIEVIKGPSSALYGSGLGGSINLYSPQVTQNEGSILTQYGSFNTGKANLSGTIHSGKTRFWGSLSHLQSDGYRENNYYKRSSLISTGEWKKTGGSVDYSLLLIGVNGGIPSSLGITQFENNPESAASNWNAIGGYKKYLESIAGIRFINKLSDKLTNRLIVFGKLNDNYERRPFNNLDDKIQSAGIRDKLNLHTTKADWVFGTEWIIEQYNWKLDKDKILLNENRENRSQLGFFTMIYFHPVSQLNISVAGAINHVAYHLTDLYSIDGDQAGDRNFPLIISPRLGINYSPNQQWSVYASAGQGYSLPSPEETLLPEGNVNPDIKPEAGMQYELGTRMSLFDKAFELDGGIYWIELNNLLVTKRISEDIFTGINAGKTRHLGFELLLLNRYFSYNSFPGKLNSSLSYTRSLNRFIDFTDDSITYNGNNLPGIPDQFLRFQIKWNPFKITELAADLQYSGFQFLNDLNSLKYPGYFLCGFRINNELNLKKAGNISLFLGVNNLTNTKYASMLIVNALGLNNNEPRYYYPGLPRHGYAGIQFSF